VGPLSWLGGQLAELVADLRADVRKTVTYVRKKRKYRTRVSSFEWPTVRVVRLKRTVWEIHHHPKGAEPALMVERLRGRQSQVMQWAADQNEAYVYLWKLQNALNAGKISLKRYYQILEVWGGCKRQHIHSQHCKYHAKH
jgi:hypothetical protein